MRIAWLVVMMLIAGAAYATENLYIDTDAMIEFDINQTYDVAFGSAEEQELLLIDTSENAIYWRGELITTNKQLVDSFIDVINGLGCRKCGEELSNARP